MKLIHCGDLHLDSKMTANLSKDKAKERKEELLVTFIRMIDYGVNENVDAILIAGDLFDTKILSVHARNVVTDAIITHPDITFYYLRGNHDADDLLNGFSLMPENLKLFDDSWTKYRLGEGIYLYGAELNSDNSGSLQENFYPDPSDINIVMLHGQESEALVKDKAEIINLNLFKNKGINYIALGHVHKYKRMQLDPSCIYCYCGCLEGRGFDECGEHGFVLLDINEENHKITDTFVPFASRTLYEIRVDISGLTSSWEILDKVNLVISDSEASYKDLVKVVLEGKVSIDCEKDLLFIEKNLEGRFYYLKVCDETELFVDYESYLHDETLKGEFVRVVRSQNIEEEEKAEMIRLGLRLIAGGEVSE